MGSSHVDDGSIFGDCFQHCLGLKKVLCQIFTLLNNLSLTGEILNEVTSEPISYSICQRMDEGRNVEHCIALEGHWSNKEWMWKTGQLNINIKNPVGRKVFFMVLWRSFCVCWTPLGIPWTVFINISDQRENKGLTVVPLVQWMMATSPGSKSKLTV